VNPLGNGEQELRYVEEVGEEQAGQGSAKTVAGDPDGWVWPHNFGLLVVEQECTLDDPIYLLDDQLVEREPQCESVIV
jgi:hypothetical protein